MFCLLCFWLLVAYKNTEHLAKVRCRVRPTPSHPPLSINFKKTRNGRTGQNRISVLFFFLQATTAKENWKPKQNFSPLLLVASITGERKLKTKTAERERERGQNNKKKAARNVGKKETYMKPSPWLLRLGEEKEDEYSWILKGSWKEQIPQV